MVNTMNTRDIVVKHINEGFHDSIEIGTAGKGGCVKVYVDYADPEIAELKILKALEIRAKMAKIAGVEK
jgi:hypothetical protein